MPTSNNSTGSGKRPWNIHDNFFKDIFEEPDNVISLIRAGAPKPLFKLVDWSTLEFKSQSIRAPGQTERHADLVLSVQLRGCEKKAGIVLLFEHKSYPDKELEKQLARNQFLFYIQDQFESLIVPIVVSQEPSPDRPRAQFINLFADEVPPRSLTVLSKYSVNFQCVVINVNKLVREGLAKGTRIDAVIRAMAKVRSFASDDLPDIVRGLLHVPAADRESMSKLVFGYICDYNAHITEDDIKNLKTETQEEQQVVYSAVEAIREEGRQEVRQEVYSAVEAFREEGRVEGLEKGRVEGIQEVAANMLHKGMGLEEVVEVTKLSRDQVETLRQKINDAF